MEKITNKENERLSRERRIANNTRLNEIYSRFKTIREQFSRNNVMKKEKISPKKSRRIRDLYSSIMDLNQTANNLKGYINEIDQKKRRTKEIKQIAHLKKLINIVYDITLELLEKYNNSNLKSNQKYITQANCADLAELYCILQELMLLFTEFRNKESFLMLKEDTNIKGSILEFVIYYANAKTALFDLLNIEIPYILSTEYKSNITEVFNVIVNFDLIEN